MTFISGVGNAIGPIVFVFLVAALLALGLTPLVRRVVLRYEIVDRPEARRSKARSASVRLSSPSRPILPST